MPITIPESGRASSKAINSLENFLRTTLPGYYLSFVKVHDGAEPEPNIFSIDDSKDFGVNRFIPATETIEERKHIENISLAAFPIAWAERGELRRTGCAGRRRGLFLNEKGTQLIYLMSCVPFTCPTHHCAMSIGNNSEVLEKVFTLMGLPLSRIC